MIIIDLWGLREYNRYNFFLLFFWTYILYWHLKQWHLGDVNTCHKKSVSSDGAGAGEKMKPGNIWVSGEKRGCDRVGEASDKLWVITLWHRGPGHQIEQAEAATKVS